MPETVFDHSRRHQLARKISNRFNPSTLAPSFVIGIVIWVIALAIGSSFTALIFHGRLASYFVAGLGIFLISSVFLSLICAFFSTDEAVIPSPQDTSAVVLAAMSTNLVAMAPADMTDEILFLTVAATMALSSILTGIFFIVVGSTRIADLMRYIPYPVIGGLLAGTGWLLVRGAFNVMVDLELSAVNLSRLLSSEMMTIWIPGMIMSLVLIVSLRLSRNMLVLPVVIIISVFLLGGILPFASPLGGSPVSSPQFETQFNDSALLFPLSLRSLAQVDILLVLSQGGGIAVLIVFSAINLLLNVSGLEVLVNRELDFGREISASGIGNLLGGILGGGIVGFPALACAALVHRTGSNGRIVNLVLCGLLLLTLTLGASIVAFVPRAVLGGLLLFFGFSFLVDWLYDAWFRMSKQDYFIVVMILAVIATLDLLWGIGIGLLISIVLFVVTYSRLSVIKQELAGGSIRSNIDRSRDENKLLNEVSDKVLVVRLQGYIFFGSFRQFYKHFKARVHDSERGELLYLILDFHFVRGIDTSAAIDFHKVMLQANAQGMTVLLCNVAPDVIDVLYNHQDSPLQDVPGNVFDDLDHAVEWCENELLAQGNLHGIDRVPIEEQFDKHAMIRRLDFGTIVDYLEPVAIDIGHYIAHQGEVADSLYFIESGRIDIELNTELGQVVRLRSMTAGTIVGEVGFYLGGTRSASIVVTEAAVIHKLSRDALHRMERELPEAAIALHTFISCALSDRLTNANRMLESLIE